MAQYLATPANGKGPGVLVLHAWWGLNDTVRQFCDRLATEGFAVLAPDLYNGLVVTAREQAQQQVDQLDGDAAYKTLEAALKDLIVSPAVFRPKVGVIGFSLGAYFALELARQKPQEIAAAVVYYGTGPSDFDRAQAAFLGHFAEQDEFEPLEGVRQLEETLRQLGKKVAFYQYGGTRHWFSEPDRPEYDPQAALLAWDRTVAFLKEELL